MINYHTAEILSVDFSGGRRHDFKLFKQSQLPLSEHTLVIADKGYQGIKKIHENSISTKICNRTSKRNYKTF